MNKGGKFGQAKGGDFKQKQFGNQQRQPFKQNFGHNQGQQHQGLKTEICKFFLTNNCHRGNDCNFSHNTRDFPCKYLHGSGKCEKATACIFKHDRLSSPQEIEKFMKDNEEFLLKLLKETGRTNLGDYFTNFLREKKLNQQREEMKGAMLP
jgi:hypothetical protein